MSGETPVETSRGHARLLNGAQDPRDGCVVRHSLLIADSRSGFTSVSCLGGSAATSCIEER
jgi:hypothetical protein